MMRSDFATRRVARGQNDERTPRWSRCQLCVETTNGRLGAVPFAVAKIADVRICAKHQRLLNEIARDAAGTEHRRARHPVIRTGVVG